MEALINYGVTAINQDTTHQQDQKTIIIMGAARSGTSMMAQVLETLGVFIGDKYDKAVFEDVEIAKLIESKDDAGLKNLIAKRNSRFDVWGWKRPETFKHLDRILPFLRNPHLIFLFRDPLAISVRNSISMNAELLNSLAKANDDYSQIIRFLGKTKSPCLLVSYEKAITKKQAFIGEVAKFIGVDSKDLEKSTQQIQLDRKMYLSNSNIFKMTGMVRKRPDHTLYGDLEYIAQPKMGVELEAIIERGSSSDKLELKLNAKDDLPYDLKPQVEARQSESNHSARS